MRGDRVRVKGRRPYMQREDALGVVIGPSSEHGGCRDYTVEIDGVGSINRWYAYAKELEAVE